MYTRTCTLTWAGKHNPAWSRDVLMNNRSHIGMKPVLSLCQSSGLILCWVLPCRPMIQLEECILRLILLWWPDSWVGFKRRGGGGHFALLSGTVQGFLGKNKEYRADAMAGEGNSLLHQTEVTLFHRGKEKDFQDFAVSCALVHVLLSIITLQTGIRGWIKLRQQCCSQLFHWLQPLTVAERLKSHQLWMTQRHTPFKFSCFSPLLFLC